MQIAIFPIPQCVTFPGTIFPLHVFEPRYRQMIQHCLETGQKVAICHTQRELSPAKPVEDLREALSSNQATYRPFDIFSAGLCELKERLPDGRMILDVHIDLRYRRLGEVQLLPYQVYEAEAFEDRLMTSAEQEEAELLRDKIIHRLRALVPDVERLDAIFASPEWQAKSTAEFSFELFGLIRFDAALLQQILEMDNARDRLSQTLSLLNA